MHAIRKMATAVLAVAVPLGIVIGVTAVGGTAWAKTSGHAAGKGTVTCTSTTATVNFKPPLLPGGTSKEKSTVTGIALTGCSGGNTATKETIKISGGTTTNSCSAFASNTGLDTISLTVKWSGVSPTKVKFPAGSVSVAPGDTGFNASGGKATGSFPTTSASFDVTIAPAGITALTNCIGGSGSVSSLQITGGSSSL